MARVNEETPDIELARLCKKGDNRAFDILVTRYQSKIINIAYSMLSNQEDAYDAAQEVFIKIYRNISGFQEKSSLSTWIYRITTNVCTDFLRKKRKNNTVSMHMVFGEEESEMDIKDESKTPHDTVEQTETQQEVREAIRSLSEDYQKVLILYDLEGMSYEEISEIINCPLGTIKSRLNRARASLRKILSEKRELFL